MGSILLRYIYPAIVFVLLLFSWGCTQQEDRILFASQRSGNSDIFLYHAGQDTIEQLTFGQEEEWGPSWITKNQISFLRQNGSEITRHRLDLRSNEEDQLSHPQNCILDDKNTLYSPVEPALHLYSCKTDIFLFDERSQKMQNLTSELGGISAYPNWNFKGDKIVFTNNQSGNNDIYLLDLKSNEITTLIDFPSNDERGAISPDGRNLLFSSNRDNQSDQDIFLYDLQEEKLKRLTGGDGLELIARWSRNGETIYLGSNMSGNWDIYSVDINLDRMEQLTDHPGFDGDPRIAPF